MAKNMLTSAVFATVIAAGSYYLGKEENREKLLNTFNSLKEKIQQPDGDNSYLKEEVGHSHPEDIEDNSMVDEGAVFSVNYYNENVKK
ncbi:hypothetical protein ACM26V_10120 [Salipaludibacillus sp. HK11]|uniref:hypothetical protein n=1 Tax=Salipaludibacillus sp. HK11 TaxID=3394320 RepID=UPI0039FBFFF8